MQTVINKLNQEKSAYILFASALLISFFLFFIDEGNYNLGWMTNPGNWLVFLIYLGLLFGTQLIIAWLLFKFTSFRSERAYLLTSGGIGVALALVIAFWAFS